MKKRLNNTKLIFCAVIVLLICMVSISVGIDSATGKVFWRSSSSSFLSKLRFWRPTPVTYTCKDSDGDDIFNQGNVIYSGKTYTDFCSTSGRRERDENRFKVSSCSGNSCYVNEYVCYNNRVTSKKVKCDKGCSNGACLKKIKESCIDTDEGKDHLKQGTITITYANGNKRTETDSCNSDGTLREWYCGEPGDPAGLLRSENYVKCPSGNLCNNGACLVETKELKSNFFKEDSIIESIMAGNPFLLDLDNYWGDPGGIIKTDSFEFKLINAFKQLGYAYSSITLVNVPLNQFRKEYGLQSSQYLDKETLILIDNELKNREDMDKQKASNYPPFSKFIDSPLNEPPKEHLAMLLAEFFSSLPGDIQTNALGQNNVWEVEEFRNSLVYGLGYNLGKFLDETGTRQLTIDESINLAIEDRTNFKYCNDDYYVANKEGNCLSPASSIRAVFVKNDLDYMYLIIHEYGHTVGAGTYLSGNSFNANYLFGEISFIMDPNNPYTFTYTKRRDNNYEEFISMYAYPNNHAEDFAESFSAYILIGKIFRERAKSNNFLQQKYDFLKNNIFKGKEFDTGDLASYRLWNSVNPNIHLPDNPIRYHLDNPDWRWNYKYEIKTN